MIAMQHVDLISHTIPDVFYPSDIWMVNWKAEFGEREKKTISILQQGCTSTKPQTIISVKMLETKSLFN